MHSLRSVIIYHTMWARIHMTAQCRCGGHSRKCGCVVNSLGICSRSMRSIHAILLFVHSQILAPSPQSVTLCWIVSNSPQLPHSGVSARRILCRRSFVGNMSCITLYQVILTASVDQHFVKLSHSLPQSAVGWRCTIRITRGGFPASAILRIVQ